MSLESTNPATGERIHSYPAASSEEIKIAVETAHRAFLDWRKTEIVRRAGEFKNLAACLKKNLKTYARLMTLEMGKPIKQSEGEIEKCAWVCEYYAENGEKFLKPEEVETDAVKSFVAFEPLGVLLAVMPWNFPFWQVFRAAVPALTAGNTMILKHASNVTGCSLAIGELFKEAGFPEGVFTSLPLETRQISELIENPWIRGVTLTGSVGAGQAVGAKAGALLKKTVLELGGSDPYVILEDANLKEAAAICSYSRLINTGQSCIAAKRFIVLEKIRSEFEKLLVENIEKQKMGDPLDETVTVGPLARLDLRDSLHQQVEASVAKGAKVLLGGHLLQSKGAFYPPTVLTDVKRGMPAYDEEMFGPVASVISASNEEEAIRIANDTVFGLGASVFTQDRAKGEKIAEKSLEAGLCFVNTYVRSDPRLPFGGVKDSGFGRELSLFGIREFVNIKTVYVT